MPRIKVNEHHKHHKMYKKIQTILVALILSLIGSQLVFAINIEELIPREGIQNSKNTQQYTDIQAVAQLPDLTIESAITSIIKTILGWSILFALVALVIAAGYYLVAQGQEDNLNKSKDIIIYLIIGLAIMASAYAIVTGLLKFKFFE